MRCRSRQETRALSTGSWLTRPHGSTERGSPTWYRSLDEGPVVVTTFDDGVHHARHLGGDRGQRLAPQVGIVPIAGDVALELVAEAVLPLPDGDLSSQPQGPAQAGVAVLRQLGLAPEGAGLLGGQIKPAELQELPVMAEAAQIAGLSQDGQGVDRADARDAAQQLVVGVVGQEGVGRGLDGVALLDQPARLADDEPEHAHRRSIWRHRQADRAAGRLVDVAEQLRLGDLAPDDIPGGGDEGLLAQRGDAGGRGEAIEEGEEPVRAAVVPEAVDLREIQRQVVGQDPMQHLGLGPRDGVVRLGQFLHVVDAGGEWIVVHLRGADADHVQHDLGVLRVVLVPAVMQGLAGAGERHGRDQAHGKAGLEQAPGNRAVIVAGGLEPAGHRLAEIRKDRDQTVVLGAGVEDAQPASSAGAGHLDQDLVAGLGDVDGYENAGRRRKLWSGHGRSVSGMRLRTPSL